MASDFIREMDKRIRPSQRRVMNEQGSDYKVRPSDTDVTNEGCATESWRISLSVYSFVTHQLCMAESNPCQGSCTASHSPRLLVPGTPSSPAGHSRPLLSLPTEQQVHVSRSLSGRMVQLATISFTLYQPQLVPGLDYETRYFCLPLSFRPVWTVAARRP